MSPIILIMQTNRFVLSPCNVKVHMPENVVRELQAPFVEQVVFFCLCLTKLRGSRSSSQSYQPKEVEITFFTGDTLHTNNVKHNSVSRRRR